jgi:glycolate oxidase
MDGRLVAELRRIAGDEWVYTAEHQLRTYESDGLLQYAATPAAPARGSPVARCRSPTAC